MTSASPKRAPCLVPPSVESITVLGNKRQGQVIVSCHQAVAHARAVNVEIEAALLAGIVEILQARSDDRSCRSPWDWRCRPCPAAPYARGIASSRCAFTTSRICVPVELSVPQGRARTLWPVASIAPVSWQLMWPRIGGDDALPGLQSRPR